MPQIGSYYLESIELNTRDLTELISLRGNSVSEMLSPPESNFMFSMSQVKE